MYTDWTRHLKDPEEQTRFLGHVLNSKTVLNRLKDLLAERELSIDISERSITSFDTPNWAYKQAFKNGFRSCSEVIKKLIDLDQQTKEKS